MKKFFTFAAIAAAMSLAACSGNTAKGTAEEDSLAVENVAEECTKGECPVKALAESVESGDASAIAEAVEAAQAKLQEIIESGDAEKAAQLAANVKAFVEENAEKLKELDINTTTLAGIIETVKALPTNAEGAAADAVDAVKADAAAAKDAAEAKANEAVDAAKAKASEAVEDAKAKASEAAENAKAKANAATEEAASKANKAASDAINNAAGKLKL